MEPLIVLVVVAAGLYAGRAAGVRRLRPWTVPLRGGLAAMFVLTGLSHFVGKRDELVAMVPPDLPAPELLVTLTGLLELAGAVGLVWAPTARAAAGGLALLLVAIFPANVYAIRNGLVSSAFDELLPRTLLQVVFLAATVAVVAGMRRTVGRGALERSRERVG